MRIALQNAGADRALLIQSRNDEFWIGAEGQSRGDEFTVVMRQASISSPDCPEALLRYVIRTQKTLIVDDASRTDALCNEDIPTSPRAQIDPLSPADEADKAGGFAVS